MKFTEIKVPKTIYSEQDLIFLNANERFCQWKYSTFEHSEKSLKKKFWSTPYIQNHNDE